MCRTIIVTKNDYRLALLNRIDGLVEDIKFGISEKEIIERLIVLKKNIWQWDIQN